MVPLNYSTLLDLASSPLGLVHFWIGSALRPPLVKLDSSCNFEDFGAAVVVQLAVVADKSWVRARVVVAMMADIASKARGTDFGEVADETEGFGVIATVKKVVDGMKETVVEVANDDVAAAFAVVV
jgi:hypothetical protein